MLPGMLENDWKQAGWWPVRQAEGARRIAVT
jgi:hypothetical protein